ncbi:hypothetical protein [Streptomyces clavifer]|uniref:hypothetical protein n=1 Tax=Streptomyces clavifer TaxID=68188 RepID=UPI0033B014E5
MLVTYVLNVIEDPTERRQTLLDAWNNTRAALVVSARLRWERNQIRGTEYGDGILTIRNTFQHLFAASELRDYVQEITGVRCLSAAPGIVYAFKSDDARLGYLARQILPASPPRSRPGGAQRREGAPSGGVATSGSGTLPRSNVTHLRPGNRKW